MRNLAPLLALVVLVSGCTVPGIGSIPGLGGLFGLQITQYEHDVVVIRELRALPAEVVPGQNVQIVAFVQNVGRPKTTGGSLTVEVELFDYCPGTFSFTESDTNKLKQPLTLLPQETREVKWTLTAENVMLETTCPPDGVKVKAKYHTTTESLTTVTFVSDAEALRRLQEGGAPTQSALTLGEGPVKPYLTVEDTQPINVQTKTTVFGFQVKNQGSGFVPGDQITDIKMQSTSASISAIATEILSKCLGTNETTSRTMTVESVRLIQKESPKRTCSVMIPESAAGDVSQTHVIGATISYDYEFRSAVVVKVKPKA